jgi:hypothetical protein
MRDLLQLLADRPSLFIGVAIFVNLAFFGLRVATLPFTHI